MTTGKTIALTIQIFVGKVMSLLLKMVSRLIIAFLPRSVHLLISCQSPSEVIFESKKITSFTVSIVFPIYLHEVTGPDAIIFVFWMLTFLKPAFSVSSFNFIKRLFSSSLLSDIRVVSSAYLRNIDIFLAIFIPACASSSRAFCMMYSAYKLGRHTQAAIAGQAYLKLLIFLLAILIPACASSSQIFHTMYSAYKLNKQNDSIQPWHTSFPIWNQSIVPCLVLIVVSWPNLWCILKVILTLALNHKDIVKSGRWDCSFCFCCCCLITLWMKVFTMNEIVWLQNNLWRGLVRSKKF